MVYSSFNIQYQRIGIGPLFSLGKIGPRYSETITGVLHGVSQEFFFWNVNENGEPKNCHVLFF